MRQNVFKGIGQSVIAVAIASVVVATTAAGQDAPTQSPNSEEAAAPAPPPPQFVKICGHCHEPDRIVETRRLRQQWEEVIEKMIDEGATGSNADFIVVLNYLLAEYGRVNVNIAPAPDLALVLHLEPPVAQAIVEYRKAQGKFADFDELLKVPNVPADVLRKRREFMVF
jgi:competence protein ComEA